MNDSRAFLDRLSAGYQDSMILLAANHLGVFGALGDGPRTAADLARTLDCDHRALELLLLALAGAGVLEQVAPAQFTLPRQLAPFLDPEGAETIHSILDHHHYLLERWSRLSDVVRSGESAPQSSDPRSDRSLRAFICGMKDISRRSSEDVADTLSNLAGCRRMLDLGGGPGTSALTFCRRWPDLHAVVFDLPGVTPIAEEEIAAAGLADRVTTLAGNYFDDPLLADGAEPYDLVYISNIIHSCSEQDTARLLTRAAGVLAPGGHLVIKDFFLDDDRANPAFGSRFAINMLVGTGGGKSYTWSETERVLADIGLQNLRRHPVAVNSGVLTARRAGA